LSDKPVQQKAESVASDYTPDGKLVAIGASTGGVDALMSVISAMPANCPPTVIAQHMPGLFTKSFAQRLNRACAAEVSEAVDGAPIKPGRIYLAPGDKAHLVVGGGKGAWTCRFTTDPPVNGHRPSVDTLFASVARAAGASAVGVILTGMGRDGANGLLEMRKAGAATIGQDEQSSLIYGMPRAAFEIGAVQKQAPLTSIGRLILSATQGRPR
jgi:two-component system chemotaxis response regulator CheB